MKTFKWILTSMLVTGLMVAGFAFDVPGARNIFVALTWFGEFLLSAVYFTGFVLIAVARNKQSSAKMEVA